MKYNKNYTINKLNTTTQLYAPIKAKYVISNMHLNYNLGIRSNGHFSLQKVSPLYEGKGVGYLKIFFFFF